jgi:hypothetical protein
MDVLRTAVIAIALTACAGRATAQAAINWGSLKTPDFFDSYMKGYEQGQRLAAARAAQARDNAQAAQNLADADRVARERQRAGDRASMAGGLIASGHCSSARAYALYEGDFDLATRVTAFCARN